MRDVAALAGVSVKTVSRVVNGEPGVSPNLLKRVEEAAEQLEFRPNLSASLLRRTGHQTRTVGLMLEDVANPFSSTIHRAIDEATAKRGIAVLATSHSEDADREREVARTMIVRRVDGLIILPTSSDHSYLLREIEAGLAVVFIDRPPAFLDADTVTATNRRGSCEAVEHLIARGHRRIAFLGDSPDKATATDRYNGYAEALQAQAIPVNEQLVHWDMSVHEKADAAVSNLLRLPTGTAPTALFTGQNIITVGAIHALRRANLQRAIALVGFDDIELADLLEPGVTVVAQDPYEIGAQAAALLFARLDGNSDPSRNVKVPTRLIPRGSGEIRPAARD